MTHKEKRNIRKAAIKAAVEWEIAYENTPSPEANESYAEAKARWAEHDKARELLQLICKQTGERLADSSSATWMMYSERVSNGYWKAKNFAEKCTQEYIDKSREAFAVR